MIGKKTKKIIQFFLFYLLLLVLCNTSLAASNVYGNPLQAQTLPQVLSSIMGYLKSIAMYLALIFIIIGGVMYMISGGDKDMMERGKKTLIYAMVGFAIVVAAPTFLKEILSLLGGSSMASGIGGLGLRDIALNVLSLLLSIVGLFAIIAMLIGSIWMFIAAGDKERYELGKKIVIYAIIGIAIAIGSLIIVQQVQTLIGSTSITGSMATNSSSMSGSSGTATGASVLSGTSGYGDTSYVNGIPTSTIFLGNDLGDENNPDYTNGNNLSGNPGSNSPLSANVNLIRFDKPDQSEQLKVTFTDPSSNISQDVTKDATYSSKNEKIASVDSSGLVKNNYSYKDGDKFPQTSSIEINYGGYSISVSVEAIDRNNCVALNPSDASLDDKRVPIVITSEGFSESQMDDFKKQADEYSKIDTFPVTTKNYVVWRSDIPSKDACNLAGSINIILHKDEGRSCADLESQTIELYYDPEDDGYRNAILAHEMGHLEGYLYDEYVEEGKDPWDFWYEALGSYNCFDVEASQKEANRLSAACNYFKSISSSYDCGNGNSNIVQGCNYAGDTDSKGYNWYRSIERGIMGDGLYDVPSPSFGTVDEELYLNLFNQR